MIIKKIISLLFTIILALNGAVFKSVQSVPVTVHGAIFGGDSSDAISLNLSFDSRWVTSASNKIYNSKLAAACAILCDDSYFRTKDVARGTANKVTIDNSDDEYTQSALLEKLGYTDVKFIETYKEKTYAENANDSATFLMGYKNVNNKYDSFIFVVRGCFSIGERLSAYDVGCDSEAYTALTGQNSEWTDKKCLKGINIAAGRAMEIISDYIAQHDSSDRQNTALTTGHSRGASIANLIGANFEKDNSIKSYTYTFSAMSFTSDSDAGSYKTIFNIFDNNDFYTDSIPFGNEKLYHYGQDISINIDKSEKLKKEIADLKGRDDFICMTSEAKAEYDKIFGEAYPDRTSLYTAKTVTEAYASADKANARLKEINDYISGLGISNLCKASIDSDNTITITYCGGAILLCIAQIQAYGESAYNATVSMFGSDKVNSRLAEIVFENLAATVGGHLIINGYILALGANRFCY